MGFLIIEERNSSKLGRKKGNYEGLAQNMIVYYQQQCKKSK